MSYGSFTQISDDMGVVVCDEWTLPPTVLEGRVQPEGFDLTPDSPLHVDAGQDGWLEVYIYLREEAH